ncbi:MAG: SprB repeat-containing protein, partial [Bacteroidetes bacterium]|nr:SprB repeat-containing protein [Bacteroidota bacterium]
MKKALLLCVFSITGYWIYAQVTATIMGTTDVTCNGYCDGTATVEGSGGTSPYTYEWDDPGMQTSPTATGLCPGTYNCTVTDAVFSTDVAIVEISEPGMLNSITMGTDPLCFGLCDGEATCTPSGGTPPYTYQWDDPGYQVTGTAINLCPGYYNVTVTDFNGCEYIDGIMINAPSELFISASKNDVTCFGYCDGSIDISVSGGVSGYVYNWSGGQTTQDLSGLCTGNYAVTVTDANGCIIDTALFISSPDEITIDMMEYNTCYGLCTGSLTATVYGGNSPYTYFWSQGGTTMSIYSLCSGAYSLTVTDGIGCVKTANPVVTENPEIGLSLEVNDISCAYYSDGSIDLTVTSGASPFSYSWSNSAYDEDIYGLGPGWYFVTVYDNNGCTKTDSAEITEPSQLWSSLFNSDPTCFGGNDGALDLTPYDGTPPYTYYWSNGLTTEDISGLTAGYYDVTVTDANGCYAYDGTELFDPPQTMLMPVSQNTTCGSNDGWASVDIGNGTPPYDYLWSNASSEDTITGIPAGIYFVTVTDGNSCTTVTQIIVNDNGGPYIYENYILDVTCNGFCNGEISMFASASAPPYSYLWSNAATDSTISGLCPGEYTLTVTDGLGCKGFEMRIISEPAELYTSSEGNDPQCPGYYDGYAWTSPVGGTTPYNYQWDDITMSTESYIPGLEAGTYHVTVTDINGCEVTDSVFLTEPSEIITSVVKTDAACFGDNSGTANLTVSGGTPPYSFNWSNAVYDEDNYNLYAGWYYVTVNDGNGCSKVDSVEIMEPSQIIASTVGTDPTCYMGDDGSIDLTVSGGVSPYFYLWNEGATDEDLTGAVAAEYSVTITDDKGCTAMTADSLNDPAP